MPATDIHPYIRKVENRAVFCLTESAINIFHIQVFTCQRMNIIHISGNIPRMVQGVSKHIDTFPRTGKVSPSPIAKDRG